MKDRKNIEAVGYTAIIISIVCSAFAAILLSILLFFNTQLHLQFILPIAWLIRLLVLLLIVVVVLQAGVLVYKINSKEKVCPKCQTPLPKWRIPKDGYEILLGGYTCPNCGTKFTGRLRKRDPKVSRLGGGR